MLKNLFTIVTNREAESSKICISFLADKTEVTLAKIEQTAHDLENGMRMIKNLEEKVPEHADYLRRARAKLEKSLGPWLEALDRV